MNIAQHIRIFEKTPDDEFVEKRTTVIDALAAKYGAISKVGDLLQLAADLTKAVAKGGALSEARAVEVEAAIRDASSSFVRENQEPQMMTCALLATLKVLTEAAPTDGVWSRYDVLALGLWSGLGFQVPRADERIEALRAELLVSARNLVFASSAMARTRQEVPAITIKLPDPYDPTKSGNSIQIGAARTIDALRLNAALDREEIDLLWWVLSDWSKFAEKLFSGMNETAAVITAGLEAGTVLRRMPGEAHKHLILRLLKQDNSVSLLEILESIKGEHDRIAAVFASNQLLAGRESIFPLVAACVAGKAATKSVGGRTLKLSEWAGRALLESSILHVGMLPKALV